MSVISNKLNTRLTKVYSVEEEESGAGQDVEMGITNAPSQPKTNKMLSIFKRRFNRKVFNETGIPVIQSDNQQNSRVEKIILFIKQLFSLLLMRNQKRDDTEIDENECLPPELTVESVNNIPYKIGLTFTSMNEQEKRNPIDHPYVVFAISSITTVKAIISMTSGDDELLATIMVDFGHYIGVRREFGFFVLVAALIIFSSQWNYRNYKRDENTTFLRVFNMMAGQISPESIGLSKKRDVRKLLSITRKMISFVTFNNNIIFPLFSIALNIFFSYTYGNLTNVLVYGLPNGLLLALFAHYYGNAFYFQSIYFIIICIYFKFRINSLHERLIKKIKEKEFFTIELILKSYESLFSEIEESNRKLWSNFFGVVWFLVSAAISDLLYMILLLLYFFVRIIFSYCFVGYFIIFFHLIFTASSVTYCVNKSYKTFYSLIISYSEYNNHSIDWKASNGIKVLLLILDFICYNCSQTYLDFQHN